MTKNGAQIKMGFAGVINFVKAGLTLATLALRESSPVDESSTPTPAWMDEPTTISRVVFAF